MYCKVASYSVGAKLCEYSVQLHHALLVLSHYLCAEHDSSYPSDLHQSSAWHANIKHCIHHSPQHPPPNRPLLQVSQGYFLWQAFNILANSAVLRQE